MIWDVGQQEYISCSHSLQWCSFITSFFLDPNWGEKLIICPELPHHYLCNCRESLLSRGGEFLRSEKPWRMALLTFVATLNSRAPVLTEGHIFLLYLPGLLVWWKDRVTVSYGWTNLWFYQGDVIRQISTWIPNLVIFLGSKHFAALFSKMIKIYSPFSMYRQRSGEVFSVSSLANLKL